jgi:hypothetical protein
MKLGKLVLLTALLVMMLGGCQTNKTSDPDNVETWEKRPFYGELRFLIVREDTGAPIPGAVLQVSDLPIAELQDETSARSGQDGRIVIHQMERGITYWGEGPPPPTLTFSALHYRPQTYSVEDLVSGTDYDPYRSDNLPTTTFQTEAGAEIELPVYEFTIRLAPSD